MCQTKRCRVHPAPERSLNSSPSSSGLLYSGLSPTSQGALMLETESNLAWPFLAVGSTGGPIPQLSVGQTGE